MPTRSAKNKVRELLATLPDNCSLEDIQYHLYVLEKVHNGLQAAEEEGTIPHTEARERVRKWSSR